MPIVLPARRNSRLLSASKLLIGTALVAPLAILGVAAPVQAQDQPVFVRGTDNVSVSVGDLTINNNDQNAIDVATTSGTISVTARDIRTTGMRSMGVRAEGANNGDVTIVTRNVTTTNTAGSGFSFLPNSTGIFAVGNGTGNVRVTAGNVSTAGRGAAGILARSGAPASPGAGNLTVSAGSVTTTGGDARGISATTGTGNVTITASGPISTAGDASQGVFARGATVKADVGNVSTSGFNSAAIDAQSGAGGVDVSFGQLATTGSFSNGINARATGTGDVTVDGAGIAVSGPVSFAVSGVTDAGDVAVTLTGNVTATGRGSGGVFATAGSGDASITVNNVNVTAANAADTLTTREGVVASGANANVRVNGTVTTGGSAQFGGTAHAVSANATNGNAVVVVNNASTRGDGADAVNVAATGMATVTTTGAITTTGANAAGVRALGQMGTNVTNTGTITTSGSGSNGIVVSGPETADVTITNNGRIATSGGGANGIFAEGRNVTIAGTGTITATGGFNNAILARGDQTVSITSGAATVTGDGGRGIEAASRNGDVTVTTTGRTSTAGFGGVGIIVNGRDATVTTAGVTTTGGSSGALSVNANRTATARINGSILTSGDGSSGVTSFATNVNVINNSTITTAGANSFGMNLFGSTVNVSGTGSVATSGTGADGIRVSGGSGAVSLQVGDVTTTGASALGVTARGESVTLVSTGTIRTSGGRSQSTGFGGVPITGPVANAVLVTADRGNANVTVNNVQTAGAGATAVMVTANQRPLFGAPPMNQDATVTVNGAVTTTGAMADGVIVDAGRDAIVNIGTGGSITATRNLLTVNSGRTTTINNAGRLGVSPGGLAVLATGGPVTINNSGILWSAIQLTGGADRINNSGTFVVSQNPDFGAGNDVFVNSGRVILAPATAPVARSFTGLESFQNAGLIDLRNGRTGDTLTLPGTYVGSGAAQLAVDVTFGATPTSDRLIIGGAATGVTGVVVNSLGGQPFLLGNGPIIVDAGAGSQAGAFVMAGGAMQSGLVQVGVIFDAANNNFLLSGAPSDAAFNLLNVVEGGRNIWLKSADVVTAQLRAQRDALWAFGGGDAGARTWAQIHGSLEDRTGSRTETVFGQPRTVGTGFKQDYFGAQLGADFGGGSGERGGFAFGVTGGYLNSNLGFQGSADRINYNAVNIGAYGSFSTGNVFANALVKYDYYWADLTSNMGGFRQELDNDVWGARGEVGMRFGSDSFFIEPAVSLSYVNSGVDGFTVAGTSVTFDDADGLRGRAGARVGGQFGLPGQSVGAFYVGGNYVREFRGRDDVVFASGAQTVSFTNPRVRDYGEAILGVSIGQPEARVSGFVEGSYIRSFGSSGIRNELEGGGGRAGLRFRF